MARDMRPELLGSKAQKIRFWIDDVDVKIKKRLEERVKIIPTIVSRSQSPKNLSAQKAPAVALKQAFNVQNIQQSGFDIDEEEVVMAQLSQDGEAQQQAPETTYFKDKLSGREDDQLGNSKELTLL